MREKEVKSQTLSEIEECVLESVILGTKNVRKIASRCGITEITANVAVRRLIEKGYLDWDMRPTELAYSELKWVNGMYPLEYYVDMRKYWRMVLELAIAVTFFVLLASLIAYLRG